MGLVVFDQARTELVQALAAGRAAGRGPFLATRSVLRTSPTAARRVAAELTDLLRRLGAGAARAGERPPRGRLRRYSLTIALIPTEDE